MKSNNATQRNTIFGNEAVGEPTLMLPFAVREALRDAVASFGAAGGQVPLASPATGEAVWAAIQRRGRLRFDLCHSNFNSRSV